ncbi:MAG: FtsW/RodA/SpoVE family cell cycle protein [Phycisphaerae bacterium]
MQKSKDYSQPVAMIAFTLMCIGVVMVYSAQASYDFVFSWYRILLYVAAVAVTLLTSLVPYRWLSVPNATLIREEAARGSTKFTGCLRAIASATLLPAFMLLTFALLALILAGFGERVNNSVRWIKVGPVQFQPSEMAKYCVIFYVSWFVVSKGDMIQACGFKNTMRNISALFHGKFGENLVFVAKLCAYMSVPLAYILLVIINDFGTGFFIFMLMLIILLLGRLPLWTLAGSLLAAAPVMAFFVYARPYRLRRILAFLSKSSEYSDINYQQNQSLMAISSGGLFGKGIGRGVCKWGSVPEGKTDFIFSIICEEFGAIGALVVVGLFTALLIYGTRISMRCKDPFGKLLAFAISAGISIQAFINILVVVKLMPNKGIPLPFISAGGTSLLIGAAGIGILMNIARQNASELPEIEL